MNTKMTNQTYTFDSYGHKNITAKHRNTFEFTKDQHVTPEGDCLVGINSNFELKELKKITGKAKMTIKIGQHTEEINFEINPNFNSDHEMVIRKTNYDSPRTYGINSNKAAKDFGEIIKEMKKEENKIEVKITC